jgi:cell division protein FtsX
MKLSFMALASALIASACTAGPRIDAAESPEVTTTVTTSTPVETTLQPTTTTTLPGAGVDIVAWLNKYSPGQTLEQTVAGWPGVESAVYVGSLEALAELERLYADQPEVVAEIDAADLPTSLRVEVTHPSFVGEVAARLRALSDVASVNTAGSAFCDRFPGFAIVVFAGDDLALTRLRNQMLATTGVDDLEIVGRDTAYAEFTDEFADFPDVLEGITVADMRVSLRAIASDVSGIPGLEAELLADDAVAGVYVAGADAPPC